MSRHVFRLFISSTFGDFQVEREALRSVWERMEAFCAAHGASFQVVDLRWGITPDMAHSHDTIQICLDEVKRCQQLSPKPNFLMLIGDRYGWRPPAVTIPDDDFQKIYLHCIHDNSQKTISPGDAVFLAEWYQKDENAVPPIWCLKPRSEEYTHYDAWEPVERRLKEILHCTAVKLELPPELYLYSATHQEIVHGLLNYNEADRHVFSFNRDIQGLPETVLGNKITGKFSDHLPDGSLDPDATAYRKLLKDQIQSVLPADHIHHYNVSWKGDETAPITTDHIEQLCADVESCLKRVISGQLGEMKNAFELELEGQEQFLTDTGSALFGRKKEQAHIARHIAAAISGKKKQPLVVSGVGGTGKSALIANAVIAAKNDGSGAVTIFRFIGATARSWSPFTFIEDLIVEIATAYGNQPPPLPDTFREQAELFQQQLEMATADKPLVIVIDGLDQFSATAQVNLSDIFPKQLPEHVALILSALDGSEQLRQLQTIYPKAPALNITPLGSKACAEILDHLLANDPLHPEKRRTITTAQKKQLNAHHNGIPLAIVLTAPLARKLASWDVAPQLPHDVKSLARYIITQIGKRHGMALTTAALRYIKLARFGLSETELQDLLWRDPEVLAEFNATKNPDQPGVDALPPVIWSRLYAELDPYINEHWMDGQLLHRYFHRVFGEVADEIDDQTRKTLHGRLAEYFAGQTLYLVQVDSTYFQAEAGTEQSRRSQDESWVKVANARKLVELPYHLVLSGRIEEARATITDFDFAMAKCSLNRSDDWASDFVLVKSHQKDQPDRDYRIWESFVRSNAHILRRGTKEWPAHKILLQLAIEHADDSPATIGAEKFLAEGKCDWAWLRRELRVEHAGIDPCVAVYEGHTGCIWGALEMLDGRILSWSSDNSLRIWDMGSDDCILTMTGHTHLVRGALQVANEKILSWSRDNTLRIWNAQNGKCLDVLEGHTEMVLGALLLPNEKIISWSIDNTLRIWSNDSNKCLITISGHTEKINGTLLLSENRILTWSDDCTLRICSSQTGECFAVLEGHTDSVSCALLLPDGEILSYSTDKTLRIWNSHNGGCIFVLKGHTGGVRGALLFNNKQILSWSSDNTLRIWNSQSGVCLAIIDGHTESVNGALLLPDKRIMSWSDDKTIRIWDGTSYECLTVFEGNQYCVKNILLLHDRQFLSLAYELCVGYNFIKLWDEQTGLCHAILLGHSEPVSDVLMLLDGRVLSWASTTGLSKDYTLRAWSVQVDSFFEILEGHEMAVRDSLMLPNERILTWSNDKSICLWDCHTGVCLATMTGHTDVVTDVKNLNSNRILSSSADNKHRLWNVQSGECIGIIDSSILIIQSDGRILSCHDDHTIRIWDGHTGTIILSMMAESGDFLGFTGVREISDNRTISWSKDNTLNIWCNKSGECLATMRGHTDTGNVSDIQLLADSRILTWVKMGVKDHSIRIWDIHSGECLATLTEHLERINGVHILPDNRILSWSDDKTLRIWDSQSGTCLETMVGHTEGVTDAKLLPNGQIISWSDWSEFADEFVWGTDYTLRLWTNTGELISILEGHTDRVYRIHILPDNKILSISYDNTLRIWSESGEPLMLLKGHSGYIKIINIFPDGRILSCDDKTVHLWSKTGEPIAVYDISNILRAEQIVWKAFLPDNLQTGGLGLDTIDHYAILGGSGNNHVFWHGQSGCTARQLFDDGRAIITQENGQVCCLRTYDGAERKIICN